MLISQIKHKSISNATKQTKTEKKLFPKKSNSGACALIL